MAQTGHFVADFSDFNAAVDAADAKLKSFEADGNKVANSLERMANSLQGQKMIQDATLMAEAVERIGGVSKLTQTELQRLGAQAAEAIEKMERAGIKEVPANLQEIATAGKDATTSTSGWASAIGMASSALSGLGIALTIKEMINLGKQAVEDASVLTNLSAKTEITTTNLQLMRTAGEAAGVSLETMTSAATTLQKKLGSDDEGAAAALRDLGIEMDHFKALDPVQRMVALSDAVKGMHDPLRVADDLSKIFGRSWADMLPALKRGFEEVRDGGTTMSTQTVKALDDAGNAAARFKNFIKVNIGEAVADILTGASSEVRAFNSQLDQMFETATAKAPNFAKAMGAIVPPGLPADLEKIVADSDAWAASQKRVAEGMAELDGLGKSYTQTLAGMDANTVEAVKWYLEAGASQGALAKAFGITEAQVRAVDTAMKDYTETLKAVAKIEGDHTKQAETNYLGLSKAQNDATQKTLDAEAKAGAQIEQLYAKRRDDQMRASLDAASYEITKIYEVADANVKAIEKSGATSQQIAEYTKLVYEAADMAASQVEYKADAVLDHVTTKANESIAQVQAATRQMETLQGGIKLPGSGTETAFGKTYLTSPSGQRVELGPHGELPANWFEQYSGISNFSGPITARAPIVPMTANGLTSGGGSSTVNFNITQPFGTPEAIARAVADAQVGLMRGQGIRLPYGT